ncbi:HAMP domain-containing sensor histidine kinase [Paludicola sp. MB14-C6]|uniref:HAMP domain-containing sensor histidine kinase n=1 Tax=Paludihabitans sp. MB14-C6 TaxID=3070656 RepID=UPI0027DB7696|nr:HAMP domain-containing sensor histidine kinase [Paludicola sp. MB14-C6]WMJ23428.1 HAMP domain-containing sensor histidine kinase [Paludicola sp. MB14-C6]
MKFFWKIFFATMFVCVICLAIGCYILINSNFHTLIDSEANMGYYWGDVVNYSLINEMEDNFYLSISNDKSDSVTDQIIKAAKNLNINTTNGKIFFGIATKDKKSIYSLLSINFNKDMISLLDNNKKGYSLQKIGNEIYVQTIRPATFFGEQYYIETNRNVTFIFNNQKDQYRLLLQVVMGVLFLASIFTFVISKLLMRQVVSLNKITNEISAGNLSKRVETKGDDEFTTLSKNFNSMANDLEIKIHELESELEKKEMFIGAVSHELKTPLTSIIGYSDMLRSKQMEKERVRLCADYIFTEGKRLETLSMKLLDLIILKNQNITLLPVSIKDLFDKICTVVTPQLNECNIELLPNIQPAIIQMEPELMQSVFVNLIDNARKAIENKGTILVEGSCIEDNYFVVIEDDGKGMEKQELSKIKEAFYVVDKSRARKQGGAGLGLSLCDQIIKMHNFGIEFESTVNVGTKVTIIMKGAKHE